MRDLRIHRELEGNIYALIISYTLSPSTSVMSGTTSTKDLKKKTKASNAIHSAMEGKEAPQDEAAAYIDSEASVLSSAKL
jgi:hypothetical protein